MHRTTFSPMHTEGLQRRRRFAQVRRTIVVSAATLVAASCLAACSASGDSATATTGSVAAAGATAPATAANTPTPAFTAQAVDIGGTTISVSCAGQGPKTVVLVSGLAEDGASAWGRSSVPGTLAANTRVCLYDRPGLGASPAVSTPRSINAHAAELGALIEGGAITGPVVLVAQGYGTFIARQVAKAQMRSVAGLVLVDPPLNELHPVVPDGASPGQQAEYASIADLNANLGAFGAGALPPPPIPTIVLGAGALPPLPADPPAGVPSAPPGTQVRDPHISEGQNQLARKSPFGSFVLVDDAGSYIQYWKPQAVIDATRKVLADTRGTR
jgi:pimeloyl-ACP methyl ester carboxylesterase